jgi:hypothetical protein
MEIEKLEELERVIRMCKTLACMCKRAWIISLIRLTPTIMIK